MKYKNENIRLNLIDSGDRAFNVTTDECPDKIADSIKEIGLINPPTLLRANNDKYKIVCGFRRIASCKKLEIKKITAKILSRNTARLDCAKLAIADNSFSRPLNLLEQSKAVFLLSECIEENSEGSPKDKTKFVKTAARLGLPGNLSALEDIKKICLLPGIVKKGILSGRISFAMAVKLSGFEKSECVEFAKTFKTLKLGLNRQKEFIALTKEIAVREGITTRDILFGKNFLKIANNDDRGIPWKRENIRALLKQRRFPSLSNARKDFSAALKKLNLKHGASIAPPKYFEGVSYTLCLPFSGKQDIKDHKKTIENLVGNPWLEQFPGYKP